jgi:hypothetical protein
VSALAGHSTTYPHLALSPDGRTLAAVGADTGVLLWDLKWRRGAGDGASSPAGTFSPEWRDFPPQRTYRRTCPEAPRA